MQLSVAVYELTRSFPREELYGLSSQLRRASVSIISNIAEGHGRGTRPQLAHFLSIARGSVFEVEAQLLLSRELGFGDPAGLSRCDALCDEVCRILRSALRGLSEDREKVEE
jgi:four helix bundle protein